MKKSVEEVGNIVGIEGLGYAVQDYLGYESIEDEKLSLLWKQAANSLNSLQQYLVDYLGEDFFDDF
jgi:uncharacterized membrane protein (Fun14 family)